MIRVVNIVYEYRSSQRKFSRDRVARSLKLVIWKGGRSDTRWKISTYRLSVSEFLGDENVLNWV